MQTWVRFCPTYLLRPRIISKRLIFIHYAVHRRAYRTSGLPVTWISTFFDLPSTITVVSYKFVLSNTYIDTRVSYMLIFLKKIIRLIIILWTKIGINWNATTPAVHFLPGYQWRAQGGVGVRRGRGAYAPPITFFSFDNISIMRDNARLWVRDCSIIS